MASGNSLSGPLLTHPVALPHFEWGLYAQEVPLNGAGNSLILSNMSLLQ